MGIHGDALRPTEPPGVGGRRCGRRCPGRPGKRGGWYGPDEFPSDGTLIDLADPARATITRDGDWIEFGHDDEGDPKWSNQTTAFYVAIAPFVRSGTVQIEGEDGARWSYTYANGQVTQQGWNGWDGSIEPFGEYVDHP